MDLRHLQAFLGHANLNTVAVYTQVGIKALKDLHQAMHPVAAIGQSQCTDGDAASANLTPDALHYVLEKEGREEEA